MILTEEERRFISNEFLALNQNANLRDFYNAVLVQSILSKCKIVTVSLTQQENGLIQSYLTYRKEGLARLTDKRLQFILQSQNSQGFGAPGSPGPSTVGGQGVGGHGDQNHYFDSGKQYNLCISIIGKLSG